MHAASDFVAVDWGTSRLRAWAVGADGGVLADAASEEGMGGLVRDGYEPALLRLIGGWLPERRVTPVIACGMVGARQGWVEAAYSETPCPPLDPSHMTRPPTRDPRLAVHIVPGLCQRAPADMMRGEETQIAGFLATEAGFAGVVCLPGTHTKWVRIESGIVVGFRTFMTGELFALLAEHSILRHGICPGWSAEAFAAALAEAAVEPVALAAHLFGLRAEGLLADLAPEAARARLSGLLIGTEIAAVQRLLGTGPVVLIGAEDLAQLYATALATGGREARRLDAGAMTRAGLAAARAALMDGEP